jgi:hypothetical protein
MPDFEKEIKELKEEFFDKNLISIDRLKLFKSLKEIEEESYLDSQKEQTDGLKVGDYSTCSLCYRTFQIETLDCYITCPFCFQTFVLDNIR